MLQTIENSHFVFPGAPQSLPKPFQKTPGTLKNRFQKYDGFQPRHLTCFFQDFNEFGSILGGPEASRNLQKFKKNSLGAHCERVSDFGIILGAI